MDMDSQVKKKLHYKIDEFFDSKAKKILHDKIDEFFETLKKIQA